MTALIKAAKYGDIASVEHAIAELKLTDDINAPDEQGKSALINAAQIGKKDVVEALLNAKSITVNHADNNGKTALIWAAKNGHTNVVMALVNANADVNRGDDFRITALSWAAHNGHKEVVRALPSTATTNAQIFNNLKCDYPGPPNKTKQSKEMLSLLITNNVKLATGEWRNRWISMETLWSAESILTNPKHFQKFKQVYKRIGALLLLAVLAASIAAAVVFGGGIPALAAMGLAAQIGTVGAFFVGAPSLLAFIATSVGHPPAKGAGVGAWAKHYGKLVLFGTLALPMTVIITLGIAKAAGASIAGSAMYAALSKAVAPVSGSIAKFFAGFGILAGIQAAGITISVAKRYAAYSIFRDPNTNKKRSWIILASALNTAAKALLVILPWSLGVMVCSAATAGAKLFVTGAKATWQTAATFIAVTDTAIAATAGAKGASPHVIAHYRARAKADADAEAKAEQQSNQNFHK